MFSDHGILNRARIRQLLLEHRGAGIQDSELVEYILGLPTAKRDTQKMAKDLLTKYGGFAGLICADWENIRNERWMSDTSIASLKMIQLAALRLLSEPVRTQPVLNTSQALLDYLRGDMAHLTIETVRILYLNSQNMLMFDELSSEGTIDHTMIYTREIIRRALNLGAASLILVHNHPSGDSQPSHQDIATTYEIAAAANKLGIKVNDHIIISKHGYSSMRSAGLM